MALKPRCHLPPRLIGIGQITLVLRLADFASRKRHRAADLSDRQLAMVGVRHQLSALRSADPKQGA